MEFRKQTVELPPGQVTYWCAGEGPPVLHLHGGGGFRQTGLLERLAGQFTVYAPVAPGFDGTEFLDGTRTPDSLARLIGLLADTIIGCPCNVIGHSFGGRLALWLALLMPHQVVRLLLESPSGFCINPKKLPDSPASLRRALFAHPENLGPEDKPAEVLSGNRDTLARYCGGGNRRMFGDMDYELAQRLGRISAPTLIVYGAEDGAVPIDSVQFLETNIPDSTLVTISDAAHAIEIDQPDRLAGIVTGFFQGSRTR